MRERTLMAGLMNKEVGMPARVIVYTDKSPLDISERAQKRLQASREGLMDVLTGNTWQERCKKQIDTVVLNTIPQEGYHRCQKNFLDVMRHAYACHYNLVITPDHVWYMVLCELATVIKANPEDFRDIFTTSAEKKRIEVPTNWDSSLNMEDFYTELQRLVPGGVEAYMLTFTTTGKMEAVAQQAAFMDAVSPFYDYGMYACGIPEVVVEGTPEDWDRIQGALTTLSGKLSRAGGVTAWIEKVGGVVTRLQTAFGTREEQASAEWDKIFWAESCGSGGQKLLFGWFMDIYYKDPPLCKAENFSSHISVVEYKDQDVDYVFKTGIFYSTLNEHNDLRSHFAYITARPGEPV
jgi:hypothetical protein